MRTISRDRRPDRFRLIRRAVWLLVWTAAAAAVAAVAIPTLTIVPFKPQTTRVLEVGYALRRAAPGITAAALVVVCAGALLLVTGPRRRSSVLPATGRRRNRIVSIVRATIRIGVLAALVAATGVVTWFCRQNHFEWMFEPLARVTYVDADAARRFLTDDETVMSVESGGEALAYPVRQMAYHHVVNTMFGTSPAVVTY
jgi:hypothetical protein